MGGPDGPDLRSGLVCDSRQIFGNGLLGEPYFAAGFPLDIGQPAGMPLLIQQVNGDPQAGRRLFAG